MKVFSQSLLENVEVFRSKGIRTALTPCIAMWLCTLCAYTSYCSSVGHCIVYFTSGIPQPSNR